mmetsp:Transcript_142297/g.248125  ORF Transcript_142297/g.248125 Transcript_142297/m.248125 type:complete len:280 (+) Transcript_142297:2978-3817(+)
MHRRAVGVQLSTDIPRGDIRRGSGLQGGRGVLPEHGKEVALTHCQEWPLRARGGDDRRPGTHERGVRGRLSSLKGAARVLLLGLLPLGLEGLLQGRAEGPAVPVGGQGDADLVALLRKGLQRAEEDAKVGAVEAVAAVEPKDPLLGAVSREPYGGGSVRSCPAADTIFHHRVGQEAPEPLHRPLGGQPPHRSVPVVVQDVGVAGHQSAERLLVGEAQLGLPCQIRWGIKVVSLVGTSQLRPSRLSLRLGGHNDDVAVQPHRQLCLRHLGRLRSWIRLHP